MKPHPSRARQIFRIAAGTALALVFLVRMAIRHHEREPFRPGQTIVWQPDRPFRRPTTPLPQPASEIPKDLPRFEIEIAPPDVEVLRGYYWGWHGRPQERPEVRATVRESGVLYTNVALHLKGSAGSFRSFDDKPALTLNFRKHAPGQRFHSYSKLSLNNSVQDPTYLCEALCRELFNQAGVPAPHAEWATVLINGRDLGLYVMIEGYNKEFLRHYFKNVKGNLYDGGFCRDINPNMSVNSGEHPEDHSDVRRLISASLEPLPEVRWTQLNQVLDMNRFVTLVAMEVLLCHWDGYAMNVNNYRLYHDLDSDRMVFMPHGMDQMFGWPPHRFEPDGPSARIQPAMRGMVANAVMTTPEGSRRYLNRLDDLRTNLFQADRLLQRVHEMDARIRPTLAAYDPHLARRHDGAVANLCDRIQRRIQNVAEQLRGPREPVAFDASGVAELTNWAEWLASPGATVQMENVMLRGRRRTAASMLTSTLGVKMDKITENGKTLLQVVLTNGGGAGSWRTRVLLNSGQYRFEGRARLAPGSDNCRVSLRISGERSLPQLPSGTEWISLSYPFSVNQFVAEVWLVCEFSGPSGAVWFDPDSLRLIRE
jgi:spore coat protein H